MGQDHSPLPRFWFGSPPKLRLDERWIVSRAANRAQGKRAVGGGLHFTNYRVFFTPNVVDVMLDGESWSCGLRELGSIGVEPARLAFSELFSGGLRSRLRLELRAGGCELFVVSSPAELASELQPLIRQ